MEVNVLRDTSIGVKDLARATSVSSHTVVRWMDEEGLPFVRVGKRRETTVEVFEWWTRRANKIRILDKPKSQDDRNSQDD